MTVAVTGATGFIGRYIVDTLLENGRDVRAWRRASSNVEGFSSDVDWIEGQLNDATAMTGLLEGCDEVIHSALYHPSGGFQGGEGDLIDFAETNIMGTLRLMQAAADQGVRRFVFVSTCAVHDEILLDRPLDEAHPLWAKSHYGAHKAALEKFVHSFGLGHGLPICAVRPTGVYGVNQPVSSSKWFDLVQAVANGRTVECLKGGKEVHAADVARACHVLLNAEEESIRGQAFSCYDQYISQWDVATIAQELSGSKAEIIGAQTRPKNQIVNEKIRALGMEFGGERLLRETVQQILSAVQN